MSKHDDHNHEVADLIGQAASGKVDASVLRRLVGLLRRSVRFSRRGVTLSGQGMADLLLQVAPRLPIRERAELEAQFNGMTGPALAGQLIRLASRNSAAVGGTTGALASAGELAPPFWVMLPLEVVAETLIIAAIEMKLVAEIHEVYGHPIDGSSADRGALILEAWSGRRGITPEDLAKRGGISKAMSKNARSQLIQVVRRKLMARAARNVSTLAPLLIGAVAGAEINRRATRDMGDSIVRDLSSRDHPA